MAIYLSNSEFLSYEELASGMYSKKEKRKIYTRLRDIAQKRLKRMKGTIWERTQTYKQNKDLYKPLAEIKTESELNARLVKLQRFINAETGTIRGLKKQRDKSIATLKSHGFKGINADNWFDFVEFMENLRSVYEGELYVSDKWVTQFNEINKLQRELAKENIDAGFKEVQNEFKKYQDLLKKRKKKKQ